MSKYSDQVEEEWDKQVKEVGKVNIMILGGTGVGKSALINYVFGENIAEEGSGEPITRGMNRYEVENSSVVLFDTEGYEISDKSIDANNFREKILPKIDEYQKKELKDQIHMAWYCLSISNNRITDFDIDNIKMIEKKLPKRIAIVLTQCDNDEEDTEGNGIKAEVFKNILREHKITLDIFETSTNKDVKLTLDMEKLITWSSDAIPEDSLRKSFIASQMYSVEEKSKEALKYIKEQSIVATGIGAAPIPAADTVALSELQIKLAAEIANIFGISSMGNNVMNLLKTQILSMAGKTLVVKLLKYFPGVGSAVNAVVAGGITYGFGVAIMKVYEKAFIDYLEYGKEPDWVSLFSNDIFIKYILDLMKNYNSEENEV